MFTSYFRIDTRGEVFKCKCSSIYGIFIDHTRNSVYRMFITRCERAYYPLRLPLSLLTKLKIKLFIKTLPRVTCRFLNKNVPEANVCRNLGQRLWFDSNFTHIGTTYLCVILFLKICCKQHLEFCISRWYFTT